VWTDKCAFSLFLVVDILSVGDDCFVFEFGVNKIHVVGKKRNELSRQLRRPGQSLPNSTKDEPSFVGCPI
jgi:hypothetical protein